MTRSRNLDEEHAVQAVLHGVSTACAANDAELFVASYAPEATASLPRSYLHTREEIRRTMGAALEGALKGSHAVHDVDSIRFLHGDVAVVTGREAAVQRGLTGPGETDWQHETWVLAKVDGEWRVETFHNCPAS